MQAFLNDMKYTSVLNKYCKDYTKIENYDKALADNFKGWVCHHRLETTLDGKEAHTPESLQRLNMYYNRPHFELIFMRRSEHIALHNRAKGTYSKERRANISKQTKVAMQRPDVKARADATRHRWPIGNINGKPRT